MLDRARRGEFGELEFLVAHFNHGIREDADEDEQLVEGYCQKHRLKLERRKESLGQNVSEERARKRRYEFLRKVATKYDGEIWTAHHADDLIETIAINFIRGTGWRGLAVFVGDIKRPLLAMKKADIYDYAKKNQLTWREDSTNASSRYLRNRTRARLKELPDRKRQKLTKLWRQQVVIRCKIDSILSKLVQQNIVYTRDFYEKLDAATAIEVLRALFETRHQPLTIPQAADLFHAIKTYKPHKKFNLPKNQFVVFSKTTFS